ncbi:hypothetical protein BK652_00610 [Pseudomonas brassicacearum]|uniref:Amine oxidase domain-containing protein n=1 Tax=Pseudomonas brassicacearum TaxID=930166 RepID=A0A423GHY0_9PSED|nr:MULTISPECIES: FAD-dependent oxidoreductase [Pseudomonas]ROM87587.1 hypothetical protein BK652_00610 [Pseudomonas brassicacearum]
MTTQKIAIVGAGLAGVYAAYRLHGLGLEFELFEARDRLGGRILSTATGGFDLGPTWFWPDCQPRMHALMAELGLPVFQQYEQGDALIERWATERVRREGYRSGNVSMRIQGGTARLVQALAASLPKTRVHLAAVVTGVARVDERVHLSFSDKRIHTADYTHLWLALPPRLGKNLRMVPALSGQEMQQMANVPTWMASHAKYVARYAKPFWREQGLSGDAFSGVGPLAEIHDAGTDQGAALFGFLGMDAARRNGVGASALKALCREQLVRLFGEEAADPLEDFFHDWAADPFTATPDDQVSPGWHGRHELQCAPDAPWSEALRWIGSEAGGEQGGYMEGALAAVDKALDEVTGETGVRRLGSPHC